MKKVFISFILSLLTIFSFSQTSFPNYSKEGSPTTLHDVLGASRMIKGMINGVYTDTTSANLGYIKYYPGAQIFATTGNTVWLRNSTATAWLKQGANGSLISTVSILNDSTLIICNINGCDTIVTNLGFDINTVTILNSTTLLVCDTSAIPICDTITIPPINITNNVNTCGLIYGGYTTWNSGLNFTVTPSIYKLCCDNKVRVTQLTNVTLSAANSSLPRFDGIFIDSTGVIVVTGTAATNPAQPQPTGCQIALTYIYVPAGSTVPGGGFTDTPIYDENIEWTAAASGVTMNFSNIITPYHLTIAADAGAFSANTSSFNFTNTSNIVLSDYTTLTFYIKLKSVWSGVGVGIFFQNTTTHQVSRSVVLQNGQYNFSSSIVGSYQTIVIPMSAFLGGATILTDKLQFLMLGDNADGFYIDWIKLQGGIVQTAVPGAGTLTGLVVGSLDPLFNTTVSNPTGPVPVVSFASITQSTDLFYGAPDGGGIPVFRAIPERNIYAVTPLFAPNDSTVAIRQSSRTDSGYMTMEDFIYHDDKVDFLTHTVGNGVDTLQSVVGTDTTAWDVIDINCYGLITPGDAVWTGDTLSYSVTSATYRINCIRYVSPPTVVVLEPADATNGRFDVIYVDTSGHAGVLTGIPDPAAVIPQIETDYQVYLTAIYIPALATVAPIDTTIIFDKNTEWTVTNTGTTSDPTNTLNVHRYPLSVNVTNFGRNDDIRFTIPSGSEDLSNFQALAFFLWLKQAVPASANFRVGWFNGTTQVGQWVNAQFIKTTIGSYQAVSIPLTAFALTTSTIVTELRIQYIGNAQLLVNAGFYIDFVYLQNGVTPSQPTIAGVTSVGLSMPSAFTVTNSPITTAGTLTVTGAGTTGQYIRGDGTLATYGAATSVPINGLLAATGGNNIDNANYTQKWTANTLADTSFLVLSSTSTAAASNKQKILEVLLSGANVTSSQSTYGIYSSNTHTGTGAVNYGIYGIASGGTFNYGVKGDGTEAGVYGNSTSGSGVQGQSTNGAAIYGASTNYLGAQITSTNSIAGYFSVLPATTSTVVPVMNIVRGTSGTPANGIGGSIDFYVYSNTPTSGLISNKIISKLTDAATSTMTSQFIINAVSNGAYQNVMSIGGAGQVTFDQYTTSNFNGGAAADSVLVVTSAGVVKKRNTSSFGGTYTASNGLTLSGSDFQWGGTLTTGAEIALNGQAINIVDSSSNGLFTIGTIPMGYYVQMTATDNSGTNFANVQTGATDVGGHAVFEATYNGGAQIANIDANVSVSTSALSFVADTYNFSNYGGSTGVVTIQNLAGTGSRAVLADAIGTLSAPVSDSTVKENIEPLEYGLETIEQFNPVSWNFKEGWRNYGEGKQIGFLAQDIAQVLPNSVFTTKSTGKMGYNETDLIPILVKAVQELNEQIKELKRNRK